MHVIGLFEDDGAERLVGEVELGHVDVHELEPGLRQPLDRLLDSSPHIWTDIRILELALQNPQTRSPSTGRRRIARPASTPRRVAVCSTVRVSVPTWLHVGASGKTPVDWHQAERRLEADDAAVRGGDADRAARVRAKGEVTDAGGDKCRGAAAGTPGRAARVERVERHPVGRVDAAGRVLQQVRLAEKLCPRHS